MGFHDSADRRLGPDEFVTTFTEIQEHEEQTNEVIAAEDAEIERIPALLSEATDILDFLEIYGALLTTIRKALGN